MNEIKKLAIKYFILGIVGYILAQTLILIHVFIVPDNITKGFDLYSKFIIFYSYLIVNLIIGIFLILDSRKYSKNKIAISTLGFLAPVAGICLLLLEKYYIDRTDTYGK